jgi:hypothetical protein
MQSEQASPAPLRRLVGRIHHDHACRILRDVLACWCAGIPMEQRREIRDKAINYLAAADTDDCVINRTNSNVCSRGTVGCHIHHIEIDDFTCPVCGKRIESTHDMFSTGYINYHKRCSPIGYLPNSIISPQPSVRTDSSGSGANADRRQGDTEKVAVR